MRRYLIGLLLGLSLTVVSWSQESDPPASSPAKEETAIETPAEAKDEEVNEELEADDESYLDTDDDDFKPTEEIPADQSIAFPTDI